MIILARRDPFGDYESESGFTFPCLPQAEGPPIFTLHCRESVAPIGRGTTGVSSCVKGPLFATCLTPSIVYISLCQHPCLAIADLWQRCEIWVRLRASNRLHRLRALASALRLTEVVDQGSLRDEITCQVYRGHGNFASSGMADSRDQVDLTTQSTEDILGEIFESLEDFSAAPALPDPAHRERLRGP